MAIYKISTKQLLDNVDKETELAEIERNLFNYFIGIPTEELANSNAEELITLWLRDRAQSTETLIETLYRFTDGTLDNRLEYKKMLLDVLRNIFLNMRK